MLEQLGTIGYIALMIVTFLFWLLFQGTFSLIVEAYHDSTMRGPEKGQYI